MSMAECFAEVGRLLDGLYGWDFHVSARVIYSNNTALSPDLVSYEAILECYARLPDADDITVTMVLGRRTNYVRWFGGEAGGDTARCLVSGVTKMLSQDWWRENGDYAKQC